MRILTLLLIILLPVGTMSASLNDPTPASGEPIHRIASENIDEVPLKQEGGIFVIPVQINGTIILDFVIDSGATDVQIPVDVFSTLVRANTILPKDLIGKRKYNLADGSVQEEPLFILRELKVGNRIFRNVLASVAPSAGSLLLGQSFLSQFEAWTLDNEQHVLKLVEKPTETPHPTAPEVNGVNQQGPLASITGTAAPRELQPSPQRAFLCGRSVNYSLDQTGSSSSFLGAWRGNWNNSAHLCGGLIVEKVLANGAAELIYVYGPSRPGSRLSWKEQHRIGFLSSDGKLSFQDDQGSIFAFDLIGAGLLRATFESRSGRLSGSFQKFR